MSAESCPSVKQRERRREQVRAGRSRRGEREPTERWDENLAVQEATARFTMTFEASRERQKLQAMVKRKCGPLHDVTWRNLCGMEQDKRMELEVDELMERHVVEESTASARRAARRLPGNGEEASTQRPHLGVKERVQSLPAGRNGRELEQLEGEERLNLMDLWRDEVAKLKQRAQQTQERVALLRREAEVHREREKLHELEEALSKSHYEGLGVHCKATSTAIRAAYR
eukprot:RCo043421